MWLVPFVVVEEAHHLPPSWRDHPCTLIIVSFGKVKPYCSEPMDWDTCSRKSSRNALLYMYVKIRLLMIFLTPFSQSPTLFPTQQQQQQQNYSLIVPTHYHVDLLGTSAFAAAAALPPLLALASSTSSKGRPIQVPTRVAWSAAAVTTWSLKLAAFLLYRVVQKGGHDNRLVDILNSPYYAAGFWIYSVLWGMLVSLPHTLGSTSLLAGNTLARQAGAVLFRMGWILETVADYQKWNFKRAADNPSSFCNVGVWSWSQHPNWCGNLLIWTGIWCMNASALVEPPSTVVAAAASSRHPVRVWLSHAWRYRRLVVSCIGPLFLFNLFHSQATGRLLTESWQANREKYGYGRDPLYTKYVDNTPLLFPTIKWW